MKYFPLIWAALWRRPTRLILTLLSVTVAFVLFGLMIGLNASFAHIAAQAHEDRIYVGSRFGGPLPLALGQQVARLPGVSMIGYRDHVFGYYQDKKNSVFAFMIDDSMRKIWDELPLTPAQWDQLLETRTGVFVSRIVANHFHLKQGDAFPVIGLQPPARQDGTTAWPFTVLAVVDDMPTYAAGFTLGNYTYLDESRPLAARSTADTFYVMVKDPAQANSTAIAIDKLFANSAVPTRSITEKDLYESASQAGLNIPFVTEAVAGAGLFMILFLTGNGIAQSVRERIPEFAVLKTLGFSDGGVMTLVFIEAAIPCLLGAVIGISASTGMASVLQSLMPANAGLPKPYISVAVLALAFGFAAIVAFASAVIPALRIKWLDVATALSGR